MIETGRRGTIGISRRQAIISLILLSVLLFLPALAAEESSGKSLILNIYLDSSGKALVTGYIESPVGLSFLSSSQFQLENDSHQLYALTSGLTTKTGDLWTLHFDAIGRFDDYRVTFYMPNQTRLGEINISDGLGYLLSASNESLVADVQGWDVLDPRISIEYQQPLASGGNSQLPLPPAPPGEGAALVMLVIAAALMIAGFGFAILLQRRGHGWKSAEIQTVETAIGSEGHPGAEKISEASKAETPETPPLQGASLSGAECLPSLETAHPENSLSGWSEEAAPEETLLGSTSFHEEKDNESSQPPAQMHSPSSSEQKPQTESKEGEIGSAAPPESSEDEDLIASSPLATTEETPRNGTIAVSSEMQAVMETLTVRERAVISVLISHGGRMTQADIRYETKTPKSSLTGILLSLERRKLVIKKEWGRTNIIELSEWFLSKKERS